MNNRYLEVVRGITERHIRPQAGLGILVTAAMQQELVAAALGELWPDALQVCLTPDIADRAAGTFIATLPAEAARAREALIALNEARVRMAMSGTLVMLVVSRTELQAIQRFAGDSYSAVQLVEICPFVPDPDVEYEPARAQLGRWLRQRAGKLDLRGFIRAHTEDTAWTLEDIYQELRGSVWPTRGMDLPRHPDDPNSPPLMELVEQAFTGCDRASPGSGEPASVVILGHPGAGKTFFLRWLALRAVEADELLGVRAPLPVLISLSAYARAPRPLSLYDYVLEFLLQEQQPAAHVLDQAVAKKQVLFLLDGLDEAGDEAGRRHVTRAVRELSERSMGAPSVATSRLSGYSDAPLGGLHITIAPLDDDSIKRFLTTWCRLYACELHGAHAAQRGEQEGRQLADDVLSMPELKALAQNPLLLTVLAIVHRAGVRLPDHRVELYSHVTQVLVERWNQVRSLSGVSSSSPIRAADAVRLLGPVALDLVRSGVRGAISAEALEQSLERSLAAGHLRSIATAGEAIALFRESLGLLVEQGPGMYSFLHLTLAEYFAAWELVRSGELEPLARDPKRAFSPSWREVILLAAGELGIIRADDGRLDKLVSDLIASAGRRRGRPSPTVPSLLAGLLADDPGLSQATASAIMDALIPTWWFERGYGKNELLRVLKDVHITINRISRGRFSQLIREQLEQFYGHGTSDAMLASLLQSSPGFGTLLSMILEAADVDNSILFIHLLRHRALQRQAVYYVFSRSPGMLAIGRGITEHVQRGALRLDIKGVILKHSVPLRMHWDEVDISASDTPYVDVPFSIQSTAPDGTPMTAKQVIFALITNAELHAPAPQLEHRPPSPRS